MIKKYKDYISIYIIVTINSLGLHSECSVNPVTEADLKNTALMVKSRKLKLQQIIPENKTI